MSFKVDKTWGSNFPRFSKPEVIGYYSLNDKYELSFDLSQLKYYNPPKGKNIEFDLNSGYEFVRRKTQESLDSELDHFLQWILLNSNKIRKSLEASQWLEPHFICFRGLLTKLWCTPFEKREGWIIRAAKWRGTIYLCALDTEEVKQQKANISEKQLRFQSWGFKFEQYIVSVAPDKCPDTSQPVNESEEFCCVFQSRFGDNVLMYGAEMDGVYSKEILKEPVSWKEIKFVELKTSRNIQTFYQDQNFRRFKLLKWWCQCFLVGIEKVLCGFRNDEGIVNTLKEYRVSEMIRLSKTFWNPAMCMNFCNEFLNYVKNTVVKDCNKCIYKFEWTPGADVQVQEVDSSSEYSFLPQWYFETAEQYK